MKMILCVLALVSAGVSQYPHYMGQVAAGETVRVCDSCETIQHNSLGRFECSKEEQIDTTIILSIYNR